MKNIVKNPLECIAFDIVGNVIGRRASDFVHRQFLVVISLFSLLICIVYYPDVD